MDHTVENMLIYSIHLQSSMKYKGFLKMLLSVVIKTKPSDLYGDLHLGTTQVKCSFQGLDLVLNLRLELGKG